MRNNIAKQIKTLSLVFLMLLSGIYKAWGQTTITSLSDIGSTGEYIINADIDASGFTSSIASFSGTLEAAIDPSTHMPYRIKNLGAPLFTTLTGTVKNLVIESVSISGHDGNTGAIACTANGAARIYNVGILSGQVEHFFDYGTKALAYYTDFLKQIRLIENKTQTNGENLL